MWRLARAVAPTVRLALRPAAGPAAAPLRPAPRRAMAFAQGPAVVVGPVARKLARPVPTLDALAGEGVKVVRTLDPPPPPPQEGEPPVELIVQALLEEAACTVLGRR